MEEGDTSLIALDPLPQEYVFPPLAVSTTLDPEQIVPSLFDKPEVSSSEIAAVGLELTVMVPVAFTLPQPPVSGIEYVNVPLCEGVPLIVITFEAQFAVTPGGKPVAVPIPVAPVVACVIFVSAALIHTIGVEEAVPAVLFGDTVIVPVALEVPQPPVSGIE